MSVVVALKTLHLAALIIWCGGLLALLRLLAAHHQGQTQDEYGRLRSSVHDAYIAIVTPAAIVAVAAGTALIFVAAVYVPWMFAKLVAVGFLVGLHGLTGHAIIAVGEDPGGVRLPLAAPGIVAAAALMSVILLLVLAKPAIPLDLVPEWLLSPRDVQLPFPEVPM